MDIEERLPLNNDMEVQEAQWDEQLWLSSPTSILTA